MMRRLPSFSVQPSKERQVAHPARREWQRVPRAGADGRETPTLHRVQRNSVILSHNAVTVATRPHAVNMVLALSGGRRPPYREIDRHIGGGFMVGGLPQLSCQSRLVAIRLAATRHHN
jgi:hypothetical protein